MFLHYLLCVLTGNNCQIWCRFCIASPLEQEVYYRRTASHEKRGFLGEESERNNSAWRNKRNFSGTDFMQKSLTQPIKPFLFISFYTPKCHSIATSIISKGMVLCISIAANFTIIGKGHFDYSFYIFPFFPLSWLEHIKLLNIYIYIQGKKIRIKKRDTVFLTVS